MDRLQPHKKTREGGKRYEEEETAYVIIVFWAAKGRMGKLAEGTCTY